MGSDADAGQNRDGGRSRSAGETAGHPPKPPYAPALGPPSLHFLRQMRDTLGFIEDLFTTEDIARFRLIGQGDVYALGHPDYLKRVLLADREQFRKSDDFRIAFGEGVLTVEGEEWRRQRDTLQP